MRSSSCSRLIALAASRSATTFCSDSIQGSATIRQLWWYIPRPPDPVKTDKGTRLAYWERAAGSGSGCAKRQATTTPIDLLHFSAVFSLSLSLPLLFSRANPSYSASESLFQHPTTHNATRSGSSGNHELGVTRYACPIIFHLPLIKLERTDGALCTNLILSQQ